MGELAALEGAVSEALEQGWRLYGSPAMSYDAENRCMKVAQAVVWKDADVVKDR